MWARTFRRAARLALLAIGSFRALAGVPAVDGSFTIDTLDTESGLPQNSVIAVTQTRDGHLWLGTLNGLVRFDGRRFTVFDESNTPALRSSRIVALFEDSRGWLWVGTEAAGIVVIRDGEVFAPAELGAGGADRKLVSACEDTRGAVWLQRANGELWRHADGHFAPFLLGANEPAFARALAAEADGTVWVGTDRRLCAIGEIPAKPTLELPVAKELDLDRLDFLLASKSGGRWQLADGRVRKFRGEQVERDLGPYPWAAARVSSACEDAQGSLVVGTLGAGAFWFDGEGHAATISTNQGLSHNFVLSLCCDREGSIWVGTDGGGLNRIRRQTFKVLPGTRGLVVQSVSGDSQGTVWFGSNGGGVGRWHDGKLQAFDAADGLVNPYVRSVLIDSGSFVYVGTFGAGILACFDDGDAVRSGQLFHQFSIITNLPPIVHALHKDRNGFLWVGTSSGLARFSPRLGVETFTYKNGLSSDATRCFADDSKGGLWIGTGGGGLNYFREGILGPLSEKHFEIIRRSDTGLPSDDISALLLDADGALWVGTVAHGLARFHAGRWTRFGTREGLASNSISYLLDDGVGGLWVGSNAGLMRLGRQSLIDFAEGRTREIQCRTYGREDGLPTRECTSGSQPAAWRGPDGRLWFPTIKGLVTVDPAQLTGNTNPPPVVIQGVFIEGQARQTNTLSAAWPALVTVHPGQARLEFQFTSLNLAAPDRARFRYRLTPYETAWTEAGNTRVAIYRKVPPGRYEFRVTACNEDGVWNPAGSALAVVVEPPFWRTWWFLSVATLALLGSVVGAVHFISTQRLKRQVAALRQQEALEHERSRIARDLHDQLGASMTQMALLGELVEADKELPAEVETHARQICQTARDTSHVLDEIVWAVNPSNDTLEGLVNYVCKYAQDYLRVAGLRFRVDAPAQLPAVELPPEVRHNVFLAAKESVTNIVRHAQASETCLRVQAGEGKFTLELADNGRGCSDASRTTARNGLKNMRERMQDAGGTFEMAPGDAGGTVVRLTVSVARQNAESR